MLLGETSEDYDKHFIMTADIDLDPNLPGRRVFDRAVIAPDASDGRNDWGRAVFDGTPFTGVFDGNGYFISNLHIQGGSSLGLFGVFHAYGSENPQIKNLTLPDARIEGSGDYIGILVGSSGFHSNRNSGSGDRGRIVNCSVSGTVRGNNYVGGVLGLSVYGTIETCCADVFVQGIQNVGGLIGAMGRSPMVPGRLITNSYAQGTVIGEHQVGGFSGITASCIEGSAAWIIHSYAATEVIGLSDVGGFVGKSDRGRFEGCFYDCGIADMHACGNDEWDTCDGISGKSSTDMQNVETFREAGWDLPGKDGGYHEIWRMPEEGGYPVLAIFHVNEPLKLSGKGTDTEPYLISSPAELGAVRNHDLQAHFLLTNDIDLSDATWSMPVIPVFGGTLDGGGHIVKGLRINHPSHCVGFIGALTDRASVRNLGIVDANITGGLDDSDTGMLAGYNSGDISCCFAIGNVEGQYSGDGAPGYLCFGGLAGFSGGNITDCYSSGSVSVRLVSNLADHRHLIVGGLVGWAGSIATSYSTAIVSGDGDRVGGLVGGPVSTASSFYSNFWDMESSGQPTSAGGIGLTTAEMKTTTTFLEAGWDFIDETENGTEDIWWIDEGMDYPRLWWEMPVGQ